MAHSPRIRVQFVFFSRTVHGVHLVSVLLLSSGVNAVFVGPILLACGAGGLLTLWWVGRRLDRNPRRAAVVVLATVVASVVVIGGTWPTLIAVVIATIVWNGAFGGLPSIYQACAVRTHALSPELAGAWVNATANAGIAGGAAMGAGLLHAAGLASLPWAGALLIAVGLAVCYCLARHFRQRLRAQPAAFGRSGGQLPC